MKGQRRKENYLFPSTSRPTCTAASVCTGKKRYFKFGYPLRGLYSMPEMTSDTELSLFLPPLDYPPSITRYHYSNTSVQFKRITLKSAWLSNLPISRDGHTEIAEGNLAPLGTVKARMRIGLIHLKRILEQMGVNEMS